MHKIIIPGQIVENPNLKPILVVKVQLTFCGYRAAPNILACVLCSVLSLQQKLKYKLASVC